MSLIYKVASHADEMEQIFRLNYKTFVEEIPQHLPNEQRKLIDRYHEQNTYMIALEGQKVVAMLAIREHRPFSLDQKIADLDQHLPFRPRKMVEIRLLAIEKEYRKGQIFYELFHFLLQHLREAAFDMAVISGTTRELRLYQRIGFRPFAHLVGTTEAAYQPMYITEETFSQSAASRMLQEKNRRHQTVTSERYF